MGFLRSNHNKDAKQEIKTAITNADPLELIFVGIKCFVEKFGKDPIKFQCFLDNIEKEFDDLILEICKKERLNYKGGKMTLELNDGGSAEDINLTASFYFQDCENQWVLKEKSGNIKKNRFCDWEKDSDLGKLSEEKKLEYPIDAPNT